MKEEKSTINSNNNRQLNKISTKTKSEKNFLQLGCCSYNYRY